MKVIMYIMMALGFLGSMTTSGVKAQSAEVQQLLLDVTKLSQFKQLLKDLQTSYGILNKGYSTIKDIAAGNFSLHKAFMDGLLMVNPSLAKYRRVADIITDEKAIVSQYKTAFKYFKSSGWLSPGELDYLSKVYSHLVKGSVDNLDALATVLTAGKLNMTDDERLTEVNRLYHDTHQMLQFLIGFNSNVSMLVAQRGGQDLDMVNLKQLQGPSK
ncbi:hypothetical protein SAMN05192529_10953 [Arachidicoccus rhizosphaerae]|uniref:TerB family tellurite resistance protein n=1 Tax=Arachidicoccus rhizosphaerae TaxID=551991 RepID=A0A1H3YTX9_9BACT|nr:hypothetical protein [Arachidicoccus rhizosphaerae]SEA15019.1 hypothetical protein SAMN05192529_10953 [Arachidicoccus rhizosphaerae]